MEQVTMNQAAPVNVFAAKLTGYIIENHPDKIEDVEFINARGLQAADVFEKCSLEGMSVGNSLYEAEKTLYAGLLFSPFITVTEVLVNELGFNEGDEEELHAFAMAMLERNGALFSKYDITDDAFGGTYEYCALYEELKVNINQYLIEYGLQ